MQNVSKCIKMYNIYKSDPPPKKKTIKLKSSPGHNNQQFEVGIDH